jgi:hypothetical protein
MNVYTVICDVKFSFHILLNTIRNNSNFSATGFLKYSFSNIGNATCISEHIASFQLDRYFKFL